MLHSLFFIHAIEPLSSLFKHIIKVTTVKRLPCIAALLLAYVFAIFNNRANAQPYYFRHYQVENGLSNSTVYCSIQDKNGLMWFGTKEGLNRFDGYHFKLFTTAADDRSLYPDFIFSLFVDL